LERRSTEEKLEVNLRKMYYDPIVKRRKSGKKLSTLKGEQQVGTEGENDKL